MDHAEIDVLASLTDVLVPHEFCDLEKLFQVKILLGGHNIGHLIVVVLVELKSSVSNQLPSQQHRRGECVARRVNSPEPTAR